jgi:hypothetical protein
VTRKQGGQPSTDLVLSAHVGDNAALFASIMALHVPPPAKVADVTFGGGVFWKSIEPGLYDLHASDIARETKATTVLGRLRAVAGIPAGGGKVRRAGIRGIDRDRTTQPESRFTCRGGVDCRALPYEDASFDAFGDTSIHKIADMHVVDLDLSEDHHGSVVVLRMKLEKQQRE